MLNNLEIILFLIICIELVSTSFDKKSYVILKQKKIYGDCLYV